MKSSIQFFRFVKVFSYAHQIFHSYHWLGKLFCISDYLISYDMKLLFYFSSLYL
jgi:hypothetical protein